jgi:hypothetical protein
MPHIYKSKKMGWRVKYGVHLPDGRFVDRANKPKTVSA